MSYEPPFKLTGKSIAHILDIQNLLTSISGGKGVRITPRLRRVNRIKSIHSSLAIEQNSMNFSEVRDIIDGKPVLGPLNEIKEVRNAKEAYDLIDNLDSTDCGDLLRVHGVMMKDLGVANGSFRKGGEGIFDGEGNCIHMAPPAELVPGQMADLLGWLRDSDFPLLVKSCVFHYEFEFIHPFEDGNGRMGRYWHTLILSRWNEVFKWVPVESVIRARQNEYYRSIAESNEEDESTRFVEFMLGAIREALDDFRKDASSVEDSEIFLFSSESAVYQLIKSNDFSTISKAAVLLNLSTATITRALRSLKDKGLIKRIGSDKKGYWVIVRK